MNARIPRDKWVRSRFQRFVPTLGVELGVHALSVEDDQVVWASDLILALERRLVGIIQQRTAVYSGEFCQRPSHHSWLTLL